MADGCCHAPCGVAFIIAWCAPHTLLLVQEVKPVIRQDSMVVRGIGTRQFDTAAESRAEQSRAEQPARRIPAGSGGCLRESSRENERELTSRDAKR
jgi:hypothetical protein